MAARNMGISGPMNFDAGSTAISSGPRRYNFKIAMSQTQTFYKFRGYNSSTGRYETWTSTSSNTTRPPSGNSLLDVVMVDSWTNFVV